ncbi:NADH-quinone oxidoreductase subunit A [Piscirickettsia salmonis]|nr:NADH-quinone oxidoreductase subunit A [Piscirickettsia salmonis]RNC79057.1 NADH-quinone oxidoreductase subunit A [Piscirickettsiaceae bacterium NZ-RLO2]AKP72431.1 NADH-quinone oxidoreductase subunit A [Piscirickettsia salmonis LF-89 = ATCC VR-1361]ALY03917.1 NADH-quinone oxidoreductase subunit A [Piscirickettsia salmonis]AMA43478.1 NADH-quinone oxidoreductase subunit A [Piscirickettsia salmonis]AOS35947.1 NADH-quinone oxidoreductase subunit A [Piscirickettsia salmonis]
MLDNYGPILLFLIIGALFGMAPMIASAVAGKILGLEQKSKAKEDAFECGFAPFEDARMKFDVRFYLVAILFIVFDLEVAFMLPWAVALNKIGWYGFTAMFVFLALLVVGFIYEWKKGALEWE